MTAIIADLQVSSASRQYVRVQITEASGGNPTTDTVTMAFPPPNSEPATFYTGSWLTSGTFYYAQCLVGPGGTVTLPVGFYDVYVKIGDNPEVPVLLSGLLEIT